MPIFKHVRNKLSDRLALPADSIGAAFRLQVIGDCIILCGCKKIVKYKSEEISALTKDGVLTFYGEHLKCVCFYEGTLEINGTIRGVTIEQK